jgi:azurin
MNLKARSWLAGVALASALALAACGGGGGPSGGGGSSLNLTTPGEQLQFQPAALNATANQPTTVNFKNGSTAQKHNWVLVKGGDDVAQKVDEAGATAGDAKGYIPDDPNIIAHTNLLDAGATGTASFTVPAGTYTFLCTFPGHFVAGMKGTLTVK